MEEKQFININGQEVPIEGERNVLEMIRKIDIDLPTFCYHSELSVYGACRLCIVETDKMGVQTSCSLKPMPGMTIKTNTAELRRIRKINLELLLANHDISCPSCDKSNNCRLQELTNKLGVETSRFKKREEKLPIDQHSDSLVHDPNKCVLCGDCVRACKEIQGVGAIDFCKRGAETQVGPAFGKSLADVECVNCGQCVRVCPVGALTPKKEKDQVWDDVFNEDQLVVAQIAPAVRVAIGEEFGYEPGTVNTGQIVAALKQIGFDKVFDTSYTADLTIMEETNEFIKRLEKKEMLPQFTSCCPSWVKFIEQYYPQLLPNLSSCKSPQQMFGSIAKKILSAQTGVAPENITVVSIMPCTAKKFEAKRPEFKHKNNPEVDHVITTSETAKMIAEAGINFKKIKPASFDLPLGFKTGAGILFGNSGGVSEAVLRTAYEIVTQEKLAENDFKMVRESNGFKKAAIRIGDQEIKMAVIHSLKNAHTICQEIINGSTEYDIIEVMACPGGCVNGGGQPTEHQQNSLQKRTEGIYNCDKQLQLHKSHENPYIQELYKDFLKEPGSSIAHSLLHTSYQARKRISDESFTIHDGSKKIVDIQVCVGTNCFLKGSQELLTDIMNYVNFKGLEKKISIAREPENIDVKGTFCFENCGKGPMVKINNQLLEGATMEKIKKAIKKELDSLKKV